MYNPEFVSLSCSFFHLGEKNLVVAGADVLRVFQMVPEVTLLLTKIHDTMLTIGTAMPGPSREPHFRPFKLSQCCTKAMPEPTMEGEDIEPRLKLECVASWRLFGWVQVGPFPVTF